MLSKFLISHFVKDYKKIKNEKVRMAYGFLGGIIGIISNILLFIIKLSVGLLSNSIAAVADAVNNLSDVASSVITILGFKLSLKPADEEHPFGYGRIEYIASLIVSFMVMLVGFEFLKSSFDKIMHPEKVTFQFIPFILILLSVAAKLWLSSFNKYLGNTIDSNSLKASALDAFSDVIISSSVALSLVLSNWTAFPVDGYIGILISLFILYSGFSLVKDTLSPLLGEAPSKELIEKIKSGVLNYEYIYGVHDLIVHDYGPGRCIASIHVEVPCDISIVKIHEIIDNAERELSKKLNIYLIIHMDPITTRSEEVEKIRNEITKILKKFPVVKSFHDFRVVGDGEERNVLFDLVIDLSKKITKVQEEKLLKNIDKEMKKLHPTYNTIIHVDRHYNLL